MTKRQTLPVEFANLKLVLTQTGDRFACFQLLAQEGQPCCTLQFGEDTLTISGDLAPSETGTIQAGYCDLAWFNGERQPEEMGEMFLPKIWRPDLARRVVESLAEHLGGAEDKQGWNVAGQPFHGRESEALWKLLDEHPAAFESETALRLALPAPSAPMETETGWLNQYDEEFFAICCGFDPGRLEILAAIQRLFRQQYDMAVANDQKAPR